jgi:hypothetical protein
LGKLLDLSVPTFLSKKEIFPIVGLFEETRGGGKEENGRERIIKSIVSV